MSPNGTIPAAAELAQRTRWGYVTLLIASGIGAAMPVGKVPPALGALQRELHLTIVGAAWVISMFSVIGALLGLLAGSVADRLGARRAAVMGLAGMAAASLVGGHAANASVLLVPAALAALAASWSLRASH